MMQGKFQLIGYASGVAGADEHCSGGPDAIANSTYLKALINNGAPIAWNATIRPNETGVLRADEVVSMLSEQLALLTKELTGNQRLFSIIGGDHTSAIGTWSGVASAKRKEGDIGLVWIDAHMDSHTPETTESGRIHGMPLAALLGLGFPTLTMVMDDLPKLKPENVCLIGVRSFEAGEAALLKRLNIRIFGMDEIKQKGMQQVMQEAIQHVSQGTVGYGMSIDLDAIDPQEAPGVDVPEPNGISAAALIEGIVSQLPDNQLLGFEIVEFDPSRDKEARTEKIVVNLLDKIVEKVMPA